MSTIIAETIDLTGESEESLGLTLPDISITLHQDDIILLGRFETDQWQVNYGWYSCNGNREVCGWYLERVKDLTIKPIQKTDLYDIYIVQS